MFYYLNGIITEFDENVVVVDCGGVGYRVNTTLNTISRLEKDKQAKLYIYDYVKEDCFELFGFYSKNEKKCFEMLISVSGVGPKAAIAILSSVSPENLALAIMNNDEKVLVSAPGIGKKIAQRVILELKDKISKEYTDTSIPSSFISATSDKSIVNNAVMGLVVLGYSQAEINSVLSTMDISGMTADQIIKEVLKKMI